VIDRGACAFDVLHQSVRNHRNQGVDLRLAPLEPFDAKLPGDEVDVFRSQRGYFATTHTVDGKQQQDRSIPKVNFCGAGYRGDQPSHIVPIQGVRQRFELVADHLNAPRAVLDNQNRLRWRWLSDPFGQLPPEDNPSGLGAFELNLRLPGQVFDVKSNLHYNYFRDYDPSTGRYVQSDPIGLRGGINTYSYVGGDPLSYVDLDGARRTRPQPGGNSSDRRQWDRHTFPGPSQRLPENAREAAGYFDDRGEFVCLRWRCDPADQCKPPRRAPDFLPVATNPLSPPEGCVCDDPRYMPARGPTSPELSDLLEVWVLNFTTTIGAGYRGFRDRRGETFAYRRRRLCSSWVRDYRRIGDLGFRRFAESVVSDFVLA